MSVSQAQCMCWFIDASKAFYRMTHYKSFGKVLKCGIPIFVVELIIYCIPNKIFMLNGIVFSWIAFKLGNFVLNVAFISYNTYLL